MAGLVPAIHVFLICGTKDVDARLKAGHDDECHNPICRDARSFMISSVPPPIALTFTSR
jgi:hypothetical protein